MSAPQSLDGVAIRTPSFAETCAFYRRLLGVEARRQDTTAAGLQVAGFALGDSCLVVLETPAAAPAERARRRKDEHPGLRLHGVLLNIAVREGGAFDFDATFAALTGATAADAEVAGHRILVLDHATSP